MAKATYYQRGETLDYKNAGTTTIEAGTIIVIGSRVGIVGEDIPAGEVGTVHVEGCYWINLAAAAVAAVDQGTLIYLDEDLAATDTSTDNTLAGYLAAPIAIGDTKALVKLNA